MNNLIEKIFIDNKNSYHYYIRKFIKEVRMFVCICNAVKESQIKTAIEQGHDSLEALQAELDVATCCGGCQPMIEGYLEEYAQSINNYTHLFIEVA